MSNFLSLHWFHDAQVFSGAISYNWYSRVFLRSCQVLISQSGRDLEIKREINKKKRKKPKEKPRKNERKKRKIRKSAKTWFLFFVLLLAFLFSFVLNLYVKVGIITPIYNSCKSTPLFSGTAAAAATNQGRSWLEECWWSTPSSIIKDTLAWSGSSQTILNRPKTSY